MSRAVPLPWVLFADVDGTLWCETEPRAVLRNRMERAMRAARVVLASSRTIEELLELEARLGLKTDLIAENGAQLAVWDQRLALELGDCEPELASAGSPFVKHLATPLAEILPAVTRAAERHELGHAIASTQPGGPPSAATPPPRRASVLLPRHLFAEGAHAGFLREVTAAGLEVVDGGIWTSISRGASKGRAARAYASALGRTSPVRLRTAAIGNSDNDEPLLRSVERPFVVRNPEGHSPVLTAIPGAVLLERLACEGWDEALRRLAD